MGQKVKHLWRGVFNLNRKVRIMYAYAFTEKQAWMVFCKRVADKDGVSARQVMDYFSDSEKYEISKEVEFKEEEND